VARVVVTGGAGFIGSNLVHALLARGDEVAVVDDFSTGRRVNLRGADDRIRLLQGDIRDPALLDAAFVGADFVFHEAALPSVARSMEAPYDSHDVNATGTLKVLEAARRNGVKRVVYAASSSAYGETPTLPKVESMPPQPISPYGVAKLVGELYCQVWTRAFGLPCVALRYFNVFGPRQAPNSDYAAVIPKFVTRMQAGQQAVIFGDGSQTRDFCFIDNVVEANLKALTAADAPGNVYNIACGQRYSLIDLVTALNGALGTNLPPRHEAGRAGDIRDSLADITAARRDLGYTAAVSFAEGLRRTVAWYAGRPEG
jgi:UDP-glucose 4-epimerase